MADERSPLAVDRLPTLTEILEFGPGDDVVPTLVAPVLDAVLFEPEGPPPATLEPASPGVAALEPRQADEPALPTTAVVSPAPATTGPPEMDEAAWLRRVECELQQHLDLVLEARLREALAPALARAADALIREARAELAPLVRDMVADAARRATAPRPEKPPERA